MKINIPFLSWTARASLAIDVPDSTSPSRRMGLALEIAIKSGADLSGADLRSADLRSADLRSADLRSADLSRAVLSRADLRSADLMSAVLSGADLRSADLSGADLRSADLRSAVLSGAKGIAPDMMQPLRVLLHQPGKIRMFKLVDAELRSPIHTHQRLTYVIGQKIEAEGDTDEHTDCGAGVNVATLDWCLRNWQAGWRILVVEFTAKDIAAIPHAGDGKMRVHRCKVVSEHAFDPIAIGIAKTS